MSAFGDAIAAGLDSIRDVAGEKVTYWRGDDSTGELAAVPGLSPSGSSRVNEVPIEDFSRDWIFKVSELVINGDVITPRTGDQVRQTINGVEVIYEVLSDGNQVYRFCDRGRTRIRVHTREMLAEE